MHREVRVERSIHTPRDHLERGRSNVILRMRAKVPENSYLFVGGLTEGLEERYAELRRKLDELLGRGAVEEEVIEREILPLFERLRGPREAVGFLSYGGKFAIPGSSLKGALRSRVEYKLVPLPSGNLMRSYSCYIVQGPYARTSTNHARFWGDDVVLDRPTCHPPKVCVTCDLFGAPSLGSRVFVSDALMEEGRVEVVGELGREAAVPGSEFSCEISLMNADLIDIGLILAGTEVLTDGKILMGAFKYRYNPKLGTRLRGVYYAGLLKFRLDSLEILAGDLPKLGGEELIAEARDALLRRFGSYIDLERGVVR